MDPIEVGVAFAIEACSLEHRYAPVGGRDVWVEFIVDIFRRMDVGYGRFGRVGIGSYLDFVVKAIPVCSLVSCKGVKVDDGDERAYHNDNTFDIVGECFITTLFPVSC
jgi:hypothetical protein